MAMNLDVTTVWTTKYKAQTGDKTTKMSTYVKSVQATAASAARKDTNTRIWNDLPHT